jgi:hypothetical protein
MGKEAEQHESDEQELVKQQVRCHDDVPSHRDERRRLYRIHPLSDYPLDQGTRPWPLTRMYVSSRRQLTQTGRLWR